MAEKYTVSIGGEDKTIKMTFGLLNAVCRTVGDIDGAAQISMDPYLRDMVLVELLSPRDATGKITEPVDIFNLDIEPDDVVKLLDWASTQALDFLLKGLERAKALQERNMPRVKALMPTSTGSAT